MLLVSGVNVSTGLLAPWLAELGQALPLTHGIAAARTVVAGSGGGVAPELEWGLGLGARHSSHRAGRQDTRRRGGCAVRAFERVDPEVLPGSVQIRMPIGESNAAIAQVEAADGKVHDGFESALIGVLLKFGSGNVGAAVWKHHYVGLWGIGEQIGDIHKTLEGRGKFEVDLKQVGAE